MILEVFGEYLGEFLIFIREIFFGSMILSSCCDKHQKFDSGCSSYPGNEGLSSDFGLFRAVCFGTSL